MTDLESASFEPCTSQAAVQDVDAFSHFQSPRLVYSDRPEGRVLSCLDPPATQAIPAICVRGSGISVQVPALRAVPVSSRLHQSREGGPYRRSQLAHPPPLPLESEAFEVPSCHSHPRSVQSSSRRAVSSSTSRGVETPSSGGSADLGMVRSCSGGPVCISRNHPLPGVLLPNRGNARHGCTGTELAPGPAQICIPPSEPTSTDTVQDQGGRGAGLVSGSIFSQQDLVPGTHAPCDSPSLADSSEEGSAFSEMGHPLAPASGPVETPRMVPGWNAEVLGDLPQEIALTIASACAPSTRWAYALKWNLFVEWCSSHLPPQTELCFPFFSKGWSIGYPPPPLRFMLLLFPLTTTP